MQKIIYAILDNQNLCKLLYYTQNNPLEQPDLDDTSVLLMKNLYPTPYAPEVQTEAKSMLNIVLDKFSPMGRIFKSGAIVFNIFVHVDLWLISGMNERPYMIMNELDKMFHDTKIVSSIGTTKFRNAVWVKANDSYHGYMLVYEVVDFS